MSIVKHPKLQALGDGTGRAKLLEDYLVAEVWKGESKVFRIPAGFITDGSSLPVGLIYGRFQPEAWKAFIVHDFLYATGILGRKLPDIFYREMLKEGGISSWKAASAYRALKWCGGAAYKNHRKQEKKNFDSHARAYGLDFVDGHYVY